METEKSRTGDAAQEMIKPPWEELIRRNEIKRNTMEKSALDLQ